MDRTFWRVDFHGSMWECRPRILWQALFDCYSANGGRMGHMDNMLIDLKNCQAIFDSAEQGKRYDFLWGCEPGDYRTTWVESKTWTGLSVKAFVEFQPYDFFVLCEFTTDAAEFTVVKRSGGRV